MPQPQDGGKFCGARINYRTKEPAKCCDDRSDDCTFMMPDGVSLFFFIVGLHCRMESQFKLKLCFFSKGEVRQCDIEGQGSRSIICGYPFLILSILSF